MGQGVGLRGCLLCMCVWILHCGAEETPPPPPRSVCGQGVSRARGGGAPPPRHAGGARAGCGAEGDRPAGGGEGRVLGEGKVPQARS